MGHANHAHHVDVHTACRWSVLIADDDRLLRESLQEILSDLGCATAQAGCGADAIALLSRMRYDLLLSDVDMPDMTGFQLLSWVTDRTRVNPPPLSSTPSMAHMKMVLMSARADQHLGNEAQRAGAVTLLAKPVGIPTLTSLIQQL
jgi:CheY-like chemotaxis protein